MITLTFVHSWFRLRRRPVPHRWVFSACNVVLASAAGAAVLAVASPAAYPALPSGPVALGLVVAAGLARWLVNRTLTSVVLMLMQPHRMTVRSAYGPAGDNLIEAGALGLGVLAAVLVVHAPALMLVLAVPVLVVHRGLLLTQFEHAAHRDSVTGLHNAGFWRELALKTIERAEASNATVGLLLVHLDDLENIGRRQGAQAANEVLRQVADLLQRHVRGDDLLGRLPGQDLAVMLTETPAVRMPELVEALRADVRQLEVNGSSANAAMTVSIGCASYPDNADTLDDLLGAADLALIAAQTFVRDQARFSQIRPIEAVSPEG